MQADQLNLKIAEVDQAVVPNVGKSQPFLGAPCYSLKNQW